MIIRTHASRARLHLLLTTFLEKKQIVFQFTLPPTLRADENYANSLRVCTCVSNKTFSFPDNVNTQTKSFQLWACKNIVTRLRHFTPQSSLILLLLMVLVTRMWLCKHQQFYRPPTLNRAPFLIHIRFSFG